MRGGRFSVAVLGLLASGTAFAGAPGWTLSETSGQVSVVSTGLVKAATRGGALITGDIVNTGRNGRAVLVRGEEYLVVAPNSRLRVADPAKSGGLTQIVESFGNVIYKIKKMTMPHFAVETPFLAAVVKGTTFSVTVTDKGASVQVIEGRVEVATRDGGASFMVLPGDIGSVSAAAPARLNVQGREIKSIESPTPEKATAAVAASVADDGAQVAETDRVRFDGAIDAAVGEGPVKLGAMSDGLVTGDSALIAVVSSNAQVNRATQVPTTGAAVFVALDDTAPLTTTAETVLSALPPAPAPEPLPVALPPTSADLPPATEVVLVALPPVAQPHASPLSPPIIIVVAPPANAPVGNIVSGNSGSGNSASGNSGNNSGPGNSSNNSSGNSNSNRWAAWMNQQNNNGRGNLRGN
jgi:hypothetical protein